MKKVICMTIALVLCLSVAVPAFATANVQPIAQAEQTFTPSVTVKDHPEIVAPKDENDKPITDDEGNAAIAQMEIKMEVNGELLDEAEIQNIFEHCLLITSVAEANKKNDKLEGADKEAHDELLEVYEKLSSGEMEIPFEEFGLNPKDMVIRDLFDGSWLCEGKVVEEDELHPQKYDHAAMLGNDPENPEDGNVLHITLDLGVAPDEDIYVFTYKHHDFDPEGEKSWGEIVDVVNNGDGTVTCTFEHLCPIAICVEL